MLIKKDLLSVPSLILYDCIASRKAIADAKSLFDQFFFKVQWAKNNSEHGLLHIKRQGKMERARGSKMAKCLITYSLAANIFPF
jgi:hypothetical protein